ncbi:MAG: tetratricopeptide repeat protein, partial [Candidatus Krumholzibacteria bacterium]|nr:tetratricopeptide repeat protein [Candidatus Krumholzibacteria bacterium]
ALAATGLFVLGISVHLFLYIRSGMNPAIDEVDPETWKSLYAHLRREQYPPIDIFNRKASLLFQFQHFGRYFREQYRMFGDHLLGPLNLGKAAVALPVALGLFGVIANFTRAKKTWVLNFTSLFLNSIGLIIFLNFSDHEVRERDYFYGGAFYFFSIFIGIGATAFLMMMIEGAKEKGRQASYWVVPVGVILLFCSIKPAHYHGFSHDRSRNYIARDYAYNMLVGLEPDAIIFTNGDNDTFPLWYIQCVENFRSDVRVANRSLLNTSWYIKQIRDEDPKVPISLSDGEIDRIRPIPLKGGGVAWKHDLIIQHIIKETNWKRPIYFAVTVPQEVWKPYTDYLEGSGMARRLVPYKGDYMINEYMIARNFDELFMFRGVLTEDGEIDESVYKNSDTRGMFTNFAVAAFQLGQRCGQAKKYKEGISKLELSLKFNPGFDLSKRLIGTYFIRSGEPQKAIEFYNGEIRKNPRAGEFWLMLANAYRSMGQLDAALSNLQEGTKHAPGYRDLYAYGAQVAALLGQREVARDFIERWLNKHPDDKDFKGLFNEIDRYFKQDSSARGTEKKGEK